MCGVCGMVVGVFLRAADTFSSIHSRSWRYSPAGQDSWPNWTNTQLRKSRAWICNVRVWVINVYVVIQLHFHLWLRWSWRYKSKEKFSRLKTVKLSKAVEQIHTTKVFTYGGLRAEHRAAGDHGLSHYSLTEKFCQGVRLRRPKITIVFHRKWVLWWMITLQLSLPLTECVNLYR